MNGHYTTHYLAEILRDLYFQESSGALHVASPDDRWVRLHFDRGMLYFGESSRPEDAFRTRLSASGLLPEATLSRLGLDARDPIEIASRLVDKQVLGKEALSPLVRGVIEATVLRAFSWPSGACDFTEQDPVASFFDADILFTFECLLKGICAMSHFGPLKDVLSRLPGKIRLSERLFLPVQQLALRPHHGYLLSRVDGTMRLDEIIMLVPPQEEDESLRFLYGLAVLGIVEFNPPVNSGPFSLRDVMQEHYEAAAREDREIALIKETADRIVTQSPAELLGVDPGADLRVLQQAYAQLKGRFLRTRFSERVREKHKRDIALIENKTAEAFLKLQIERLEKAGGSREEVALSEIDPEQLMVRREMVKTQAQATQEQNSRLGERYFQKAKEYFHEKDFHNCIQFCQLAIKYNEEGAAAHFVMAEALSKNPTTKWQRLAEEAYARACELDPWNAEYQVAFGNFYRSQGMDHRAKRHYAKALEILPSHVEAKAAMKGRAGRGRK